MFSRAASADHRACAGRGICCRTRSPSGRLPRFHPSRYQHLLRLRDTRGRTGIVWNCRHQLACGSRGARASIGGFSRRISIRRTRAENGPCLGSRSAVNMASKCLAGLNIKQGTAAGRDVNDRRLWTRIVSRGNGTLYWLRCANGQQTVAFCGCFGARSTGRFRRPDLQYSRRIGGSAIRLNQLNNDRKLQCPRSLVPGICQPAVVG